MMRRTNLPGILFLGALAGLWQFAAFLENSPTFPSFVTVIGTLVGNRGALLNELGHTLLRAAAGFGLALGTMLACWLIMTGYSPSAISRSGPLPVRWASTLASRSLQQMGYGTAIDHRVSLPRCSGRYHESRSTPAFARRTRCDPTTSPSCSRPSSGSTSDTTSACSAPPGLRRSSDIGVRARVRLDRSHATAEFPLPTQSRRSLPFAILAGIGSIETRSSINAAGALARFGGTRSFLGEASGSRTG